MSENENLPPLPGGWTTTEFGFWMHHGVDIYMEYMTEEARKAARELLDYFDACDAHTVSEARLSD